MRFWKYTPNNHMDFNEKLRALIDSTPKGKQSQKQPVSHYDGYNHAKSYNANYPEFQHSRHYATWYEPEATTGYIDTPPPEIDKSDDQVYKIAFWQRVAPLLKQFARDVAVKPETKCNYQINVDMMWFHQMQDGDYDNWHNHSFCQWVGVYYIDLPIGKETLLMDYDGLVHQPDAQEGDLLIFPSTYMHKSPFMFEAERKTVINFNFNISSKYTKETINKVKQTHPNNYFDTDEQTNLYKYNNEEQI